MCDHAAASMPAMMSTSAQRGMGAPTEALLFSMHKDGVPGVGLKQPLAYLMATASWCRGLCAMLTPMR